MPGSRFAVLIAWVAGFVLVLLVAGPALAADGGPGSTAPSYYEEVAAGSNPAVGSSAAAGLPAALSVVDVEGGVAYEAVDSDAEGTRWRVSLELAGRRHERVDAVYDLVLALPLPADGAGAVAFTPEQWGITPREGSASTSVPLIYAGEKLVLKRNVGLERAWLPLLAGAAEGLPDLAGTGYRFTLWDAIVRYDAGFGDRVQGVATLRYRTASGVGAPDPADARLAAFLIVWIPELDPTVKPYTVRLDVRSPEVP